MRKTFLKMCFMITIVLLAQSILANCTTDLEKSINLLIASKLPNTNIGIAIMDAETGKMLCEKNSYQAFSPASNAKLFTAASALYFLGPNYTFPTTLLINPNQLKDGTLYGNLYIVFNGDPSLTIPDFIKLLSKIKSVGITTIQGNIIIDNTRFDEPNYIPGMAQDDINWYYAAPITSIILNQNFITLWIKSNNTLGEKATVTRGQYTQYMQVLDDVKTVTEAQANSHCELLLNVSENNTISLKGCWPMTNSRKTLNIAIRNPLLFAEKIIQAQLTKNKIKLLGEITTGKAPKKLQAIGEHTSPPLKALLIPMMKYSNNTYAATLTKTIGSEYYHHGTFQEGANAMQLILHQKTNIDFSKAALYDGAGSRYNLISPQQIVRLLYVIYHSSAFKNIFIQTLPDSGIDGTLQRRMKTFDLLNHIEAKTGTLTGISTLSGYLTTQNNRKIIFSILINHIVGSTASAKKLQNEICQMLVAL